MSGNAIAENGKMDRRIRRTRDRLGGAIMALVQEKDFDTITVQDVLDRAQVGRSTFYTHFRDRDDLFLSEVDEFYQHMAMGLSGKPSDRVLPVRELFAHIAEVREFVLALMSSGRMEDVIGLAQEHFARGIAARLAELPRARGISAAQRGPMSHALAGALLSMQSWWIDHGMVESPAEMDELFHRLVWSGVDSTSVTTGPRSQEPRSSGAG
jgi:AcrR family transcriptional regulator